MTDDSILGRLAVSRETTERLKSLEALLNKWNPAINLVSKSTLPNAWDRHILDSAQIFELAPSGARHWVDLGSGGGFPGLVVAALAAELAPELSVTLVESDLRKATFLRQGAQGLGLRIRVLADRIEQIDSLGADVLSARALASLPQLCAFAARHMDKVGTALFPKGANWRDEVTEASRDWRFDLTVNQSAIDAQSVILCLKAIEHV